MAEVTEILRQQGDYRKAAQALSEGRTEEAWAELDKLGWIRQVPDDERYRRLADAYLSAVSETKRNGDPKTALVVSPTHAEAQRVTEAIRNGLKARGGLEDEHVITAWAPAHPTDARKADPTQYDEGTLIQFHQNAPGHPKGSRLLVTDDITPPVALADRFEVYRPVPLALAAGDRIRITVGGKTKDGHRVSNGIECCGFAR